MMTSKDQDASDAFNLLRFVEAQQGVYQQALRELQQGRKQSHWMWFIFPQVDGLGNSPTARQFAIKSLDEARAYLSHPVLGSRLLESCRAILAINGKSVSEIFGYPDDMKLRSSMTLFSRVCASHSEFREILHKYFGGDHDQRTIDLLEGS